jgi:hypothetical protein
MGFTKTLELAVGERNRLDEVEQALPHTRVASPHLVDAGVRPEQVDGGNPNGSYEKHRND